MGNPFCPSTNRLSWQGTLVVSSVVSGLRWQRRRRPEFSEERGKRGSMAETTAPWGYDAGSPSSVKPGKPKGKPKGASVSRAEHPLHTSLLQPCSLRGMPFAICPSASPSACPPVCTMTWPVVLCTVTGAQKQTAPGGQSRSFVQAKPGPARSLVWGSQIRPIGCDGIASQ